MGGSNLNTNCVNSTPINSKLYTRTLNSYTPTVNGGVPFSYVPGSSIFNSNNGAAFPPCVPVSKQLGGSNPIKTVLYAALISGNGSYIDNVTETDEINRMLMYRDLDQDSALMLSDNNLVTFYNAEQGSDIGQLTQIEQLLSEANFTTASSLINAYTPNTNIQANYKRFYELYIAYTNNGSLTSNETADLDVLAHKCPLLMARLFLVQGCFLILPLIILPLTTMTIVMHQQQERVKEKLWQLSTSFNPERVF